jgi:hypothetical protein
MLNDLNNGFEGLIRSKLEDYRTPVSPDQWDAIEKSLIRRKHTRYFYTATGIVAAAVVLFLVTLYLPKNDNGNWQDAPQQNVVSETTPSTIQSEDSEQVAETTEQQQQQSPQQPTEQEKSVSNPESTFAAMNIVAVQVGKDELHPEDPPVKEKLTIVPKTVSDVSINISLSNKLQLPNNMRLTIPENKKTDNGDDTGTSDNKRLAGIESKPDDRGWSFSVNFSAGGYQNVNETKKNSNLIVAAPILTSSGSSDFIKNKYKNEIMVPDNANSQYGLPLSAKFIVRKDLNSRWAIESGLSYTYLPTKYKWNKNTVNQHLHYLGIPLNVVYYAVSKPKWNVYASAGGMVEKGVYSYIDRSDDVDARIKMKGLQWSVNGSIGTTYKLYKGLGIFFEPQFGYFFDSGQPESMRTEWPISFGVGVGLRFSF